MKVKFLTVLNVSEISDSTWRIESDFIAQINNDRVRVPVGFVTDFANVPRLPFAYILFGDRAHRAAVLHDYLYSIGKCKREYADAVLKAAMQADGLGWLSRNAMWAAVRLFGGSYFVSK